MEKSPICSDCNEVMESGFIPDHYTQVIRSHWHPGPGTDKTFFGKPQNRQQFDDSDCGVSLPEVRHFRQFAH